MIPRVLGDYGAPFSNAQPVEDPTTECDADQFDLLASDVAALTCTPAKIRVAFPTVASGNSTVSASQTVWGNGSSYHPTTITRTGVGLYTITYPSTFDDALDNTDPVAFTFSGGHVSSLTVAGHVQGVTSSNVINIVTMDLAGAAADLTAGTRIEIWGA